jgi:hypothetical protein
VQRIRIFVEHLAGLERARWAIVDLDLVSAFQDVADRVAARMPMRAAAVAGIALGEPNRQVAAHDVAHLLFEQVRGSLSRLRLRLLRQERVELTGRDQKRCERSGGGDRDMRQD